MPEYKISIELPDADQVKKIVNDAVFPKVQQAIRLIAEIAAENWKKEVANAKLWQGEKRPYIDSITVTFNTPLSAVISSDYKYASDIETGRPPYDLKRMLNTSNKVRTSQKTGRRYMIIPFRHNTPDAVTGQAMPQDVYAMAKDLAPSRVTGMGQRPAGHGAMDIKTRKAIMTPQRSYAWGDKLPKMANKNHSGMYRFDTSSSKARSSAYMTFRVMVDGSPGWTIPARPGLYLAKKVADELQPLVDKVIAEAFKQT